MPALIRPLDPGRDRPALARMLDEAQDYYLLWLGHAPGQDQVQDVLTAAPPGCDPAQSHRLGLFVQNRLCGVCELSFGYPAAGDAYLGLMILAPWARSAGNGAAFHDHVLGLARERACAQIYLGVLDANRRGWNFWRRMGYVQTGVTRTDAETGHLLHRLVRPVSPG